MRIGMKLASKFNPKAKLWIDGRKNVFQSIKNKISASDKVIWMHAPSLGECEQGLPVFTELRKKYPNNKFAFSFFSPSGYEIMKDKIDADIVFYLPLDTENNVNKLMEVLHPELVIFVKYDFWYNLLRKLSQNKVRTIFISAIFRKNQIYFKPKGKWFLSILKKVDYFFVQDENSKKLLNKAGINQVKISGDTRFDRVKMLLERDNNLDWVKNFKGNDLLIVVGSSWKEDENILKEYINKDLKKGTKILIAPHNIDNNYLEKYKTELNKKTILYSELDQQNIENAQIIVVNTIGILTKIYSYSDISYVGGAFGKAGVHNVLEPAVFGAPVIYGPIFHQFIEAEELSETEGAIVINNYEELRNTISKLIENDNKRKNAGQIAQQYILEKPNSTNVILDWIFSNLIH